MKNIKIIILSVLTPLLLVSCEDFLNNVPRHQWPVEEAMKTFDKAKQSVNGIYGRFMTGDNANQDFYVRLTTRSGLIQVTGLMDFSETQANSPISLWTTAYSAINAANLAINGIPGVPDSAFPTTTAKNELLGEARLLRGYFYSLLLLHYSCWWDKDDSKFGIVYRDQTSNVGNVNTPRITVGESWTKVIEDLDFAIANMPNTFVNARKVSKTFAKAWKAKLLLIRGTMRNTAKDLTDAKTLIDDAIATLPAAIKMESDMNQTFLKAWDSQEHIFVRYVEDVANRTSLSGYWSTYGFSYTAFTAYLNASGQPTLQSNAVCGVRYGLDWIRTDPRWFVHTGRARAAETWDTSERWVWKKIYRLGSFGGANASPKDEKYAVYHMRLPELYLMQAELIARTGGSNAQAIAPINLMRSKRTVPELAQLTVPATKEELLDIIFKEYINELILENGTEFYASFRFEKEGKTYMEVMKAGSFVFDKTKLQWPIPNNEMLNNPLIEQNPGQK
ncbi:MAG: RagB/SusD family nutrient uptake outer membrane protein [Bacteroidales bacterium]|nr:RagB/SusD family nutrient uptake outer membrane protein [Bacteroidales bacterium]